MTTTNSNTSSSASKDAPLTNATVQLTNSDGNAFLILGRVRHAIIKSNHPELAQAFIDEAMAGDYDHLLQTCFHYVTVE